MEAQDYLKLGNKNTTKMLSTILTPSVLIWKDSNLFKKGKKKKKEMEPDLKFKVTYWCLLDLCLFTSVQLKNKQ